MIYVRGIQYCHANSNINNIQNSILFKNNEDEGYGFILYN